MAHSIGKVICFSISTGDRPVDRRVDLHLLVGDVGHRVDRQAGEVPHAERRHQPGQRDDEPALPDREREHALEDAVRRLRTSGLSGHASPRDLPSSALRRNAFRTTIVSPAARPSRISVRRPSVRPVHHRLALEDARPAGAEHRFARAHADDRLLGNGDRNADVLDRDLDVHVHARLPTPIRVRQHDPSHGHPRLLLEHRPDVADRARCLGAARGRRASREAGRPGRTRPRLRV